MDGGAPREESSSTSPSTTTTTSSSTTPPASPPSPTTHTSSSNPPSAVKKRQRIACDNCRQRKSKCDGTLPCGYCKEKGISCRYAEPTRRGPISKKECNSGLSFSVFTEYKMMQTLETKQYITLYMEHVNPLFPVCSEARLMNPQSTAQKAQTYVALAFVSQVYCDSVQSKMFIANAKQLASSFFDEPSTDAAIAMTMMGQYWFNLTSDHVNASQYSSLGYSLAKHLPMNQLNSLVRNFSYFYHILLDPALAPSQSNATMANHIPTLKTANWAISDIFGDFMLIVSKIIRYLRLNLSITSTFANLCLGSFTENDRMDLINSINQLDYKLFKSPKLPDSTRTFYTITTRMTRCYVEWKSGHLSAAGEAGVQILHLFISLQAAKKLYIMLVDRPYITVEFAGLVVCAMREAGRQQEADELLTFVQEYFPTIVASSRIIAQIDAYFQNTKDSRPILPEVPGEDASNAGPLIPLESSSAPLPPTSVPSHLPPHMALSHPPYPPSGYPMQSPFSSTPIYLSPNPTLGNPPFMSQHGFSPVAPSSLSSQTLPHQYLSHSSLVPSPHSSAYYMLPPPPSHSVQLQDPPKK